MTTATALIPNAITIAIIAFAVSVSMSKIFGKRHNYEIDSNQVSEIVYRSDYHGAQMILVLGDFSEL